MAQTAIDSVSSVTAMLNIKQKLFGFLKKYSEYLNIAEFDKNKESLHADGEQAVNQTPFKDLQSQTALADV